MRSRFDRELDTLNVDLQKMSGLVENALENTIAAFKNKNTKLAKEVMENDRMINDMERSIESICFKLMLRQQPVARDLRIVTTALKIVTDLERIGDQCSDICEIILDLSGNHIYRTVEHIPDMLKTAKEMVHKSIEAFVEGDVDKAHNISRMDDDIDSLFLDIKNEIIQIMKENSENADDCLDYFMIAKYLERIGDHAIGILNIAEKMNEKDLKFSDEAVADIKVIVYAVLDVLKLATTAYKNSDEVLALDVEPLEQVVDRLIRKAKKRHVKRLQDGKCTVELDLMVSDLFNDLERISDHCSNIATSILQIKEGALEKHELINRMRSVENVEFSRKYDEYKAKYPLVNQ